QNLIFAGNTLQDDQTLEFYQIANGATLHLVLNLTGDIGEWLEPSEADRRILFDAGSALATPPSEQQYHDQYQDSVPVAANQHLIFAGKRLQDDQTLEFYQIANGATLHLVV
ncbi:hypothetical protein EMIHUDRAFT_45396, partial [Emiliania huxleyi CCMP1516]|uniref:Ubiquitin-like domain-containing protein n=2 Tax=Emiliania huxleyi TaxID=2903 RepID=A0A0D3ITI0_EMIH1